MGKRSRKGAEAVVAGARVFATRVVSNLQRGNCDVVLGDKTLIIGANRAGKDTVLRSVSLALGGRADDVGGRESGQAADLMALAPEGVGKLFSSVTLSSGVTVEATVTGSTESASLDAPGLAGVDYVARELVDYLTIKGVKERRAFFSRIMLLNMTHEAVEAAIPAADRDTYAVVAGTLVDLPAAPLERLNAVGKQAMKQAAESRAAAQVYANEATLAATPPVAVVDVESAQQAYAQALAHQQQWATYINQLRQTNTELTALRDKWASVNAKLTQAKADLAALPAAAQPISPEDIALADAAVVLLRRMASYPAASTPGASVPCACCGSDVNVSTFTQAYAYYHQITEVAQVAKAREAKAREVETMEREQASRVQRGQELANLLAGIDIAEAERSWQAVQAHTATAAEQLSKAKAASAPSASGDFANKRARALEMADKLERLAVSTTDIALRLMQANLEDFCARVSSYLPSGWAFGIDLHRGDRDVCFVGLRENGHLRSTLSGAERTAVYVALGCVIAELRKSHVVIVPPECAVDPDVLTSIMAAAVNAPAQILLTSIVHPAKVPKGWTVVDLGGAVGKASRKRAVDSADQGEQQVAPDVTESEEAPAPTTTKSEETAAGDVPQAFTLSCEVDATPWDWKAVASTIGGPTGRLLSATNYESAEDIAAEVYGARPRVLSRHQKNDGELLKLDNGGLALIRHPVGRSPIVVFFAAASPSV